MDKKSVLGFVLIFLVILAMPYYFKIISNGPTESVNSTPPTVASDNIISDPDRGQSRETEGLPKNKLQSKENYGNPNPDTVSIETDLYRLTISSRGGGTFNSVVLKNFKKISGKDTSLVELIPQTGNDRFIIRYINTNGDSANVIQNFSVIPSRAPDGKNYFYVSGKIACS
jgi:YidC/Oxa1 family membrane protein insertase